MSRSLVHDLQCKASISASLRYRFGCQFGMVIWKRLAHIEIFLFDMRCLMQRWRVSIAMSLSDEVRWWPTCEGDATSFRRRPDIILGISSGLCVQTCVCHLRIRHTSTMGLIDELLLYIRSFAFGRRSAANGRDSVRRALFSAPCRATSGLG